MNMSGVDDMARCLDGSPYIFYVAPGDENVMIWLEGGGWCYSLTDCLVRSRGCSPGGACGSSAGRGPTSGTPMGGILSWNATVNPGYASWTKVYAPYCDGDSFSGMVSEPVQFNGSSLFFRGAYNLRAMLSFLRSPAGNSSIVRAPQVVLTGCSAGGLAVYLHADEVAAAVGPTTDFRAIPVSGFFSNAANAEGAPIYAEQMRGVFALHNASGGVNQACVAAQDAGSEWVCNMALASMQYTTSRIFPLNSHTDWWQTACVWTAGLITDPTQNGKCASSRGYASCAWSLQRCDDRQAQALFAWSTRLANDMQLSETGQLSGNGGFITSCHAHCEANTDSYWMGVQVDGVVMRDAVAAWMASPPTAPPAWHTDCHLNVHVPANPPSDARLCNPTCGLHCDTPPGSICEAQRLADAPDPQWRY